VVFLHQQTQMLIGSPMSVKATGDGDPKSGDAWEEAW